MENFVDLFIENEGEIITDSRSCYHELKSFYMNLPEETMDKYEIDFYDYMFDKFSILNSHFLLYECEVDSFVKHTDYYNEIFEDKIIQFVTDIMEKDTSSLYKSHQEFLSFMGVVHDIKLLQKLVIELIKRDIFHMKELKNYFIKDLNDEDSLLMEILGTLIDYEDLFNIDELYFNIRTVTNDPSNKGLLVKYSRFFRYLFDSIDMTIDSKFDEELDMFDYRTRNYCTYYTPYIKDINKITDRGLINKLIENDRFEIDIIKELSKTEMLNYDLIDLIFNELISNSRLTVESLKIGDDVSFMLNIEGANKKVYSYFESGIFLEDKRMLSGNDCLYYISTLYSIAKDISYEEALKYINKLIKLESYKNNII